MSESLETLNIHIWMNIFSSLEPKDIFSISLTSKSLKKMTEENAIWQRFLPKMWFFNDIYDLRGLQGVTNYLEYFRFASNLAVSVTKTLDSMVEEQDVEVILKKGQDLIFSPDEKELLVIIAVLKTLRKDRKIDYRKRLYVSSILQSIRKQLVMNNLEHALKEFSDDAVEVIFFLFSYFDPAFDDLLPYRDKFYEDVDAIIKSNIPYNSDKSPDETIDIAVKAMNQVFSQNIKHDEDLSEEIARNLFLVNDYSSEDFSILRIYAGEVYGSDLLKLSIAQLVLRSLGFKSIVTIGFLIIYDDSLSQQKYAVWCLPSKGRLIIDYLDNDYLIENRINFLILVERFKFNHSLNEIMYASKGSKYYKKLYPVSNMAYTSPYLDSEVLYFLRFCIKPNSKRKVWRYLWNYRRFLKVRLFWNSYSLINFGMVTLTSGDNEMKKGFIKRFFNPINLKFHRNRYAPHLKIGQIVKNKLEDYYGIVIQYHGSYLLFPQLNKEKLMESSLELVENYDPEIIDILTYNPLIGFFFSGYNQENNRFIPDRHLSQIYPVETFGIRE